jgi:peptide/nickel transport system substrate-binding protein
MVKSAAQRQDRRLLGLVRSFSLALVLMIVTACGGAPAAPANAPAASENAATEATTVSELPAGEPKLAEKQELVAGISRNLVNGPEDWLYAHTSLQVWEPLVAYDDQLRPQPGLAESWEMSADGKTWTFKLREGVKFSNGDPLTVEDVIATIEHFRTVSGRPSIFLSGINFPEIYGDPTAIEKADERTLRLVYAEPRPLLIYSISNHYSAVYSAKNFDAEGNFKDLPIGTGRYRLVDWKRDQYAILERNENYWGELPTLTRIELKIYPNESSRLSALKAGEIDALVELGAVSAAQARELRNDPNFVVSSHDSTCTTHIAFNGDEGKTFSDVRLRQAVSLGIDREALVRDLLYEYPKVAQSILIHTDADFFNPSESAKFKYDPNLAKQLVTEAAQGQRVKAVLIFTPPGEGITAWPYPQMGAYFQALLQPIGIDLELKQLESAALTDARNNGEFDLVLANYCWSSGDPNYILGRITSSKSNQNVTQHGGFNNPEVDELLAKGLVEVDAKKRQEYYFRIQEIGAQELPIAPLYDQPTIIAYRPYVKGLSQRVAYAPTFETVYIEER